MSQNVKVKINANVIQFEFIRFYNVALILFQERGLIEVEMKDMFTRYTNDVIASSAFGLSINSLEERDNEFYKMGKKTSDFSGIQILKFFLFGIFPRFMQVNTSIKNK